MVTGCPRAVHTLALLHIPQHCDPIVNQFASRRLYLGFLAAVLKANCQPPSDAAFKSGRSPAVVAGGWRHGAAAAVRAASTIAPRYPAAASGRHTALEPSRMHANHKTPSPPRCASGTVRAGAAAARGWLPLYGTGTQAAGNAALWWGLSPGFVRLQKLARTDCRYF